MDLFYSVFIFMLVLCLIIALIPWGVIIGSLYYITAWIALLFTPEHNTPPGEDKYPDL